MHPVGFEPTISAGERPKTHALDRAASGTGCNNYAVSKLLQIDAMNVLEYTTSSIIGILELNFGIR